MDDIQNITDSTSQNKNNKLFVPLAIVGLIVIAAVGVFAFQGEKKDMPQAVVETTQVPTSSKSVGVTVTSKESVYKDGEYKAVGKYTSPGGAETLGVTVILKGDIIESAEVETMGDRPNTMKFQGIFKDNFKSFVVGKNIDEVKLDKVSGSSLAPKGFNDALDKVKKEARA